MPSGKKETYLGMYERMLTIRYFETKMKELALAGKTPTTFFHLSIGQEATAVGVCSNLTEDDYLLSTHRGHGHCIAKGVDVKKLAAEILGRSTGFCKGKGGTMHIAVPSKGVLAVIPIVGANIPLAVGAGLAAKMEGKGRIAVSFFGEGASNQGVFHESLNLASIWDLPVVFVCENNKYGEATDYRDVMRIEHVSERAAAYGIPGETIDGNDIMAVFEATRRAVERARSGKGPTLLEAMTYRYEGHYLGDPEELYRSKQEVEDWKKKDPIMRFEQFLLSEGTATKQELDSIANDVRAEIEDAGNYALSSSLPPTEEAFTDIFASGSA